MNGLAACSLGLWLAAGLWPFSSRAPETEPGTIASLKAARPETVPGYPGTGSIEQAMAQYQRFLDLGNGPESMRAEAMRRLADLNLSAGENAEAGAEGAGAPYYAEAVRLYTELLAAKPGDAEIRYQLARAQEGAGRGDEALATLDALVGNSPDASHADEAQFRRGETYFVRQDYGRAEQAYAAVLAHGASSPFYAQALYKQGWALFKQGRNEESLVSFLALLDRQLPAGGGPPTNQVEAMSRPERELLDDTLRVTSITYSYLDGAEAIPPSLAGRQDPAWTYLLYLSLGDLYLEKERFRDAAVTYEAFVARDPVNEVAPRLQQASIEAYTRGKFPALVLDAKRKYVENYGLDAGYWSGRSPADQPVVVAQLKTHLGDLAAHDHAEAQRTREPADYGRAADWYRRYLAYFPDDPDSAGRAFLLGELLYESRSFGDARDAYLRAAYDYGAHAQAAEAGYAALLASREQEALLAGEAQTAWHAQHIEYSLKFADTFPADSRAGTVLVTVAEELLAAGQLARAAEVAGLVLTLQPPAAPELERVAWTVRAHAQFDLGQYAAAEQSYQRLMAYPLPEGQRTDVETRIAAAIYRQAEAAQAAGNVDAAVADFLRISAAAPGSDIRPTALFDAATLLLAHQRHDEAVALLQRFRAEFPADGRNADVTAKLAVALKDGGRSAEAAAEFERMAATPANAPEVQRTALWQAAELYAAAGRSGDEARVYETLVQRFPAPVADAMEARQKLAALAAAGSDWNARQRWLQALVDADAAAGAGRSDRSRYLAATAAIELARPGRDAFLAAPLNAPLEQSLKRKTALMQAALTAYARAADYGVAGVTTAATFETADLYYQLSRDLMASERPAELSAEEQEQYDLLLEEQAFPFEEKALDLYRANAQRAAAGVYDEWVRASFARLAVMAPARYARAERSEDVATWLD